MILLVLFFLLFFYLTYILINYHFLKKALEVHRTTFKKKYFQITIPLFLVMGILTLLPWILSRILSLILREYHYAPKLSELTELANIAFFFITFSLLITAILQGIIFIIALPKIVHKSRKTLLPYLFMANGIPLLVIIFLITPIIMMIVGALYSILFTKLGSS